MPDTPRGRRSPALQDRRRDAERSKRLLLAAAVEEFSRRGFHGARVGDIAERAGLNKQLISYYFGGKQGLYDAISDRWRADEQRFAGPGTTLVELAERYARVTLESPDLARLVIREGLDGPPGSADSSTAQRERFQHALADLERRQQAGELAADLDPACVSLALFAICAAPASFPHLARAVGLDPGDPAATERYVVQVARLVARLRAS